MNVELVAEDFNSRNLSILRNTMDLLEQNGSTVAANIGREAIEHLAKANRHQTQLNDGGEDCVGWTHNRQ